MTIARAFELESEAARDGRSASRVLLGAAQRSADVARSLTIWPRDGNDGQVGAKTGAARRATPVVDDTYLRLATERSPFPS